MATESERRFLLRRLPDAQPTSTKLIRQVYWNLGSGWALRLRRAGTDHDHEDSVAIKGPRVGSDRPEFEWPLQSGHLSSDDSLAAHEAALALYAVGSKHQIIKLRYSYLIDGQLWDIDRFDGLNDGLIIAELEMKDRVVLERVPVPSWVVCEITGDVRYNNENLAYNPISTWT